MEQQIWVWRRKVQCQMVITHLKFNSLAPWKVTERQKEAGSSSKHHLFEGRTVKLRECIIVIWGLTICLNDSWLRLILCWLPPIVMLYFIWFTFSGFDKFSNPPLQDSVWIYRICWNKDAFFWGTDSDMLIHQWSAMYVDCSGRKSKTNSTFMLDYLKKCRGKILSIIFVHIEEYWGFVDLQFRISLLFWQSARLTTSDAPCCWTVDWGWVVKNCDAHDKIALHHTEDGKAPFFFVHFG